MQDRQSVENAQTQLTSAQLQYNSAVANVAVKQQAPKPEQLAQEKAAVTSAQQQVARCPEERERHDAASAGCRERSRRSVASSANSRVAARRNRRSSIGVDGNRHVELVVEFVEQQFELGVHHAHRRAARST